MMTLMALVKMWTLRTYLDVPCDVMYILALRYADEADIYPVYWQSAN